MHEAGPTADALKRAIQQRQELLSTLAAEDTNAVRLLHGVAEEVSGLTVDRYGDLLLVQTNRAPLAGDALDALKAAADAALGTDLLPVWNHRIKGEPFEAHHAVDPESIAQATCREAGLEFDANPRHRGLDPLLFLDFRAGRRRVREASSGKRVLNLFAYTCGVGVAALAGGAKKACNVDFASSALRVGRENAARNDLAERFEVIEDDFFPVARQFAGLGVKGRGAKAGFQKRGERVFDLTIVDPPRYAKSRFGTVDLVNDYPSVFKPALLSTRPGGQMLCTHHVPKVPWAAFEAQIRRAAEKAGRPIAEVERLLPDADFPSFDGEPPLKMAWLTLAP